MAKRLTPEERYKAMLRKQQKQLEEFAAHEIEWADHMLLWYKLRKEEIPDDEYRAVAYFKNKEWLWKPGSLALLYSMYNKVMDEMPPVTKENAFYLEKHKWQAYSAVLNKGGF